MPHSPGQREILWFLSAHEEELEVEFDCTSAPVPLPQVDVGKEPAGSAHLPDSVEEDKAVGPPGGYLSPGYSSKVVCLSGG